MKRLKNEEKLIQVILALLGTYGVCCLCDAAGMARASFSVLAVPVLIVVWGLLGQSAKWLQGIEDRKGRIRKRRYAGVLSFLFSAAMIAGYQLQTYGMTEGGVRGKCLLLIQAASLGVAVFPFGLMLFTGIEKLSGQEQPGRQKSDWKPAKVFGISAAVIFLCLIPVWLAYYPIIMSYDFHRQINEAVSGFEWFWPYQPLAHTWVIWLFAQIGYLLGSLQTGMACMALFQMLAYSLVAAYACAFLYRITVKKWTVIAGVLFFGVFPLNSVLVLCTTKDVLFGTLFLLFALLLGERFFFCGGRRRLAVEILLVLEGCLMIQFRNNCLYAIAVFGVLWVIFVGKKERLRVLILCVLLIAGGKGTGIAIKAALGTRLEVSKVEMYSVPIQQFARIGYFHGNSMDQETRQLLESYVPAEYWQDYNPPIADAVKGMVGVTTFPQTWDGHMGQLLADWFRLGVRYPNEYIDAFLELTRGYWFLDDRSYAECLGYGTEDRMGTIYTYNSAVLGDGSEIVHESRFPWLEAQLEKIVSGNAYYGWPILSLLFKSAFYCWGLLLVFLAFVYLRRKRAAVLCLFPLMYLGTMLLGPVVQMRYVFPVMLALPVLLALLRLPEDS